MNLRAIIGLMWHGWTCNPWLLAKLPPDDRRLLLKIFVPCMISFLVSGICQGIPISSFTSTTTVFIVGIIGWNYRFGKAISVFHIAMKLKIMGSGWSDSIKLLMSWSSRLGGGSAEFRDDLLFRARFDDWCFYIMLEASFHSLLVSSMEQVQFCMSIIVHKQP